VNIHAFGYLSLPASAETGPDDVAVLGWALADLLGKVAVVRGCELVGVFSDPVGGGEAGFYSMLRTLRTGQVGTVIVPDLGHLHRVSCLMGADLLSAARFLRVRLVVAGFCAGEFIDGNLRHSAVSR
jgi:hypothetical protein